MNIATKVGIEILSGEEALLEGSTAARHLWNHVQWLDRQRRQDLGEDGKPQGRYPGNYGYQKLLRSHWAFSTLCSRCAEATIKDFDIAMRSWWSNLKTNKRARPPKYCDTPRTLTFDRYVFKPRGNFVYQLTVIG